ncbi:hypothetical protein HPO96_29710 [Kribbella sandramycini]|uniref:Uncharacterized protein n=1 Tax=Kribbella sandramycini TaxID=60450 RepID=A0A7Y4L766_9ACTN|nr:hypothetical protein [Kribbella sandramycini]MBB6571789.1 hypothetical protein [Kribbella sandramycini]NOL44431.1 hypothetical protein [Kribbella sandramycini]
MSESPDERFRTLPEPVRLEDTIATHPASEPADPDEGRNAEQDLIKGIGI